MFSYINKKIQEYSDKEYSFITGNGTSAIYLTLKASNIPKGSKIAVPNIACPDPVYALIWAEYKPVFIDVNIEDYNINIDSLETALQEDRQIKAIIAIHLFGNACDIVNIRKIAKKYNCFLLEDCAQAFGNEIDEGKLGSFGDVSIFSFGNGKIVEVGHGGSVQTNDKALMNKITNEYKKLQKYDKDKINKLSKIHRSIYYKLYYLGMKYSKLNILNLVYVYFFKNYYLYQLDELYIEHIKSKIYSFKVDKIDRINIIEQYIQNLQDDIQLPTFNNKENILSRLTVSINNAESISKKIRDNGIASNTMYPMLVDRFKIFFNKDRFKNSYKFKGKLLNLWVNSINKDEIDKSVRILKELVYG